MRYVAWASLPKIIRMARDLLFALCAAPLCTCQGDVLKGMVVNIQNEPLPGVLVTVKNSSYQDLTNAMGEYVAPYRPGRMELRFAKTGYTSAVLTLDVGEKTPTPPAVSLWSLPQTTGVFLFENYRYREIEPIDPQRFETTHKGVVFGTIRWYTLETVEREPFLVCYKLPPSDVRVSRMRLVDLTLKTPYEGADAVEAWVPVGDVPAVLAPIDEPDRLLTQVRLANPLKPGAYAVHWGALEGLTESQAPIFFFNVTDVLAPVEPPQPQLGVVTEPVSTEPPPAPEESAAEEDFEDGEASPEAPPNMQPLAVP